MTKPINRKMAVDCLLWRIMPLGALPCGLCGEPLKPGDAVQFDHIHAIVHQGPHEYQNLRPVHAECHKAKSKRDVAANFKGKRIRGETCTGPKRKISGRGFDKSASRNIPSRGFPPAGARPMTRKKQA